MASYPVFGLKDAVDEYLANGDFSPRTQEGHRAILGHLVQAFPDAALESFEAAGGTALLSAWLEERWGESAPGTYNRGVSVVRELFRWHTARGKLPGGDPGKSLARRPVVPKSRNVITESERSAILAANPEPWDSVPLRLFLDWGLTKGAMQGLRFRHFDPSAREVTFARGQRERTLQIDNNDLWNDFQRLRELRRATDDEFVVPKMMTRRFKPRASDLAAMEADGILDGGTRYVFQKLDGTWRSVVITPNEPRGDHALHDWWYDCLENAGLVAPGVTKGYPIMKARHSVGRALYTDTGSFKAVRETLGVSRAGTTSEVYANRDADELDMSLRSVRHALRTAIPPTMERARTEGPEARAWWLGPNPIRRLTDYIEEERGLVELSRVGIELLRNQEPTSGAVQHAATTLTRAVSGVELVQRADEEALDDHPLLHGHSLTAIWGALETMTLGVVAAWLTYRPTSRIDKIADIKVPYAMFEDLSQEDRVDALVHELDQQRGARRGVERFETLLAWVRLSGSTDADLARNLYEMQQVRNVFAHRGGIVDRRFVEQSPQFGYTVGKQILIDRNAWHDSMIAALAYAETVLLRMREELGLDRAPRRIASRPVRWRKPKG